MSFLSSTKYFDGKISHGFVSLYTSKTITMISGGLLGLFLPIFIYNLLGQNFQKTMLFYGAGYFLYAISLFLFVRFLNKFGFRRALRASTFLGALYFTFFYFIDETNYSYFLPAIIVVITLYRLSYWLPYQVDFAKFTSKKNRGKQISAMKATREAIGIFIPLIAGLVIKNFGFDILFIVAIILYLVSYIPYLTIPRTKERYMWNYKQTLENLISKKNRKQLIAFMSDGAETAISAIVWPIFIFQVLKGDFLKLGALSTLIIAVTMFLQLMIGKKLDKTGHKNKILKFGSMFSSISWVIKIFVVSAFHVFVIGAFHNIMRIFTRIPFDSLTYEIAADEGHYVDEFTVLHEIAVSTGRVLMVIFAIIISLFYPIQYVFIIAAVSAIFLNLLRPHLADESLSTSV